MAPGEDEKMQCSNCGLDATRTVGTYQMKESGLNNLTLIGVDLIECSACGNVDPIIPDITDLMRAIAWHLATQSFRLSGEHVRFLRKYLRMNGKAFSDLLGVDNSTLSKWENEADPIGSANERLVRSLALALGDGLKERSEEGIKMFTWITDEYHHGPVDVDMNTLEVQSK
jgi:putative zinc finger/helix-turn-helix YgiT family protein